MFAKDLDESFDVKSQQEDRLKRPIRVVRVLEYVGPADEMRQQLEHKVQDTRHFGNVAVTLVAESRSLHTHFKSIEGGSVDSEKSNNLFTVEKVYQLINQINHELLVTQDYEAADSITKRMHNEFVLSIIEDRCPNIKACAKAIRELNVG